MISQLNGKLAHKEEKLAVIDVGGVGFRVFISASTAARLGNIGTDCFVWTHLAVRDDALDLYGFTEKNELDFFALLISVSGIGPKSAINILSSATPDVLHQAIAQEDPGFLSKAGGLSQKVAEKIVRELAGKIDHLQNASPVGGTLSNDALEALKSLGYSNKEALDVLRNIPKEITDTKEIVREALKYLKN